MEGMGLLIFEAVNPLNTQGGFPFLPSDYASSEMACRKHSVRHTYCICNDLSCMLVSSALQYRDHLNLMVISLSHSYEQSGLKMATAVITP